MNNLESPSDGPLDLIISNGIIQIEDSDILLDLKMKEASPEETIPANSFHNLVILPFVDFAMLNWFVTSSESFILSILVSDNNLKFLRFHLCGGQVQVFMLLLLHISKLEVASLVSVGE